MMEYVLLGNYIKLKGGGTPSKDKEDYWNGNIPWASVKDLKSDYIKKTQDKITQLGVENSATSVFEKGTLIIATRMAVGKSAFLTKRTAINQDLKAILCSTAIDKKYLFYYLKSQKKYFDRVATGATVKGIKIQHIVDLKIPLPPLPEQKRIANILDQADQLRQLNQQILAQYDALTQSLFLDMFGDPVVNPMGWEVKKLKDVSTRILSGTTPKGGSSVYVEKGITFFRSQNVWKNRIVYENVAYIDQATHDKMTKSSLKYGDILMTKTGRVNTENSSLGRSAMFLGEDDSANINGHVYLIRLQENIINEFVLFILTTDRYRDYIRSVCVGGIDKRQINKEHLEVFPIIFPPISLQNQFAEKIKNIEAQKAKAKAALEESENLFNCLLQKAFKGEL